MTGKIWCLIALVVTCGLVVTGCTCECGELAAKNRKVAEQAFEVIVAGDFDRLDEFIAADYVRHSQASPVAEMTNLEQFKQWLAEDRAAFPDGHAEDPGDPRVVVALHIPQDEQGPGVGIDAAQGLRQNR